MGLPGGKRRKEILHSKASESAAHVAGFGLHLEGYGPPNLPDGFFDSLRRSFGPFFFFCFFLMHLCGTSSCLSVARNLAGGKNVLFCRMQEESGVPLRYIKGSRTEAGTGHNGQQKRVHIIVNPQRVEKVRLRRPFPSFTPFPSRPPWGSRVGNGARKPCTARFPNPPHMSPDSDCIWRATALQTSRKGFLTV